MKRLGRKVRFLPLAFLWLGQQSPARATDYTWSGATNTSYNVPASWGGTVPGVGDNAFINTAVQVNLLTTGLFINNLELNNASAILNHTAGTYAVSGNILLSAGTYTLNGGTITSGTITRGMSGTGTMVFGTSGNSTLSGTLIGAGALSFATANGRAIFSGGTNFTATSAYTTGASFQLSVNQAQALDNLTLTLGNGAQVIGTGAGLRIGTGSVIRASAVSGTNTVYGNGVPLRNDGFVENTSVGTLNVYGVALSNFGTIRNQSSGPLNVGIATAGYGFTNQIGGFIEANGTGLVTLTSASNAPWVNAGTLRLTAGASMNLGGYLDSPSLGTIERGGTVAGTAGTLTLSGNLTLAAALDLAAVTGPLLFNGGTINGNGNSLTGAGNLLKPMTVSSTLDNVQIAPTLLDLSTTSGLLLLSGGSNFTGATTLTTASSFQFRVNQAQAIDNLTLILPSSAQFLGQGVGARIGLGSTIRANASTGTSSVYGNAVPLRNDGLIENTGVGTLSVYGVTLSNYGTIRGQSTGPLNVGSSTAGYGFTNMSGAFIEANGTGLVTLDSASNAPWVNAGTIRLATGASVNLDGYFNAASLGTIERAGVVAGTAGNLTLTGDVTLNAAFDLVGSTGPLRMNLGIIHGNGNTLSGAGNLLSFMTGNSRLDNVKISPTLLNLSTTNGYVTLQSGSNFPSATALTTGTGFQFHVDQAQSLDNLTLTLSTGASLVGDPTNGLRIGSTSIIRANSTSTTTNVTGTGSVRNDGLIENVNSAFLNVNGVTLTNYGTIRNQSTGQINVGLNSAGYNFTNQAGAFIEANGTGIVTLTGPANLVWINAGTIRLAAGSTVNLAGGFNSNSLGTIERAGVVAGTAGTLSLTGTMTLGSALNLAAVTGPLVANAGTITGNGNVLSGGNLLSFATAGGTLNNVQISPTVLNLSTANGVILLTSGSNFTGAANLTTGAGFEFRVNQTQSIDNLTLTLGSTADFRGMTSNGARIGSTATIKSTATTGTNLVYGDLTTLRNDGIIENLNAGTLNVYGKNLLNYGTIRNQSTGPMIVGINSLASHTFINQPGAFIEANGTGAVTLRSSSGFSWQNLGTLKLAAGATMNLAGEFGTNTLGTILRGGTIAGSAGTLTLNGVMTLESNFNLASAVNGTGRLITGGATIAGAGFTLSGAGLLAPGASTTTLSNVQLSPTVLDLSSASAVLVLSNGSAFTGATTLTTGSSVQFQISQSLALDNLTLILGNNGGFAAISAAGATIGATSTIRASSSGFITGNTVTYPITNNGIMENVGVNQLQIYASAVTNNGTIRNTNIGSTRLGFNLRPLTMSATGILEATAGTISFDTGALLTNYTVATQTLSLGTYRAVGSGTLNFAIGAPTITTLAANTTVEFGGTATFAALAPLQINNGAFTISGGKSFMVNNAATAFTNAGNLSILGSGSFTIPDAYNLTNYGSNTLTGGTWNVGGSLVLGAARPIVTLAAGTTVQFNGTTPAFAALTANLTTNNGTLRNLAGSVTLANTIVNASGGLLESNGGALTIAGDLSNNAGATLNVNLGGNLVVQGQFTNNGNYTVAGSMTTNNAGFLNGGSFGVTGTVNFGTTLAVNLNTTLASGTINVNGITSLANGVTLTVNAGTTFGGAGAVNVNTSQFLVVNGSGNINKPVALAGTLSGSGNVGGLVTTSSGAAIQGAGGTLLLSTLDVGGNTSIANNVNFSGAVNVNAGTLFVPTGAAFGGAGTLTVQSAALLDVNGVVNKPVTVLAGGALQGSGTIARLSVAGSGALKPGNSPGLLTILERIELQGTYEFDIRNPQDRTGGTAGQGGDFDRIDVTGGPGAAVVVRSSSIIRVRTDTLDQVGGVLLNSPNSFWLSPRAWNIIQGNATTQFDLEPGVTATLFDTRNDPYPYAGIGAFTFAIDPTAHSITMSWQPVPEPTTILGFAAAGLLVGRRLRRRGPTPDLGFLPRS